MITIRKRKLTFHVDVLNGRLHPVRGSLGTRNRGAALRIVHRIEIALAEGPRSRVWAELRPVLPCRTFERFVQFADVETRLVLTWQEFRDKFESQMNLEVRLDQRAPTTAENYQNTLNAFELFLHEKQITTLHGIDASVIDEFKPWRLGRIKTRKANGASALELDLIHLHHVFNFAIEKRFMQENPVHVKAKQKDPSNGHQPFSADELKALRNHADDDLFIFLFLFSTGFRRSDATILRWDEVHFNRREIEHVCKKTRRQTGRKVIIPIGKELVSALKDEYDRRNPQPSDRVLLDPATGKPFDKPHLRSNDRNNGLSDRIKALGKRAGVRDATTHRFRDTFAVDMLLRTDNTYYVAQLLGDNLATVERYYLRWVRELREGARLKLGTSKGIEQFESSES